MQEELIQLLKEGSKLCNKDVAVMFKTTRQHASIQLAQIERSFSFIKSYYEQQRCGCTVQCVKFYFYDKTKDV